MRRRSLIFLTLALIAAGCKNGDAPVAAANESPLPKTPNATAADNAANLKNANMPESAKKIMGGNSGSN